MAFGKEIKRLRDQENLSVSKLAQIMGINAYRLRKWEEYDFDPRYEDAKLIEAFFKIPIDQVKNLPSLKPFLNVTNTSKVEQGSNNSEPNEDQDDLEYKEKYIRLLEKREHQVNLTEIEKMVRANTAYLKTLHKSLADYWREEGRAKSAADMDKTLTDNLEEALKKGS